MGKYIFLLILGVEYLFCGNGVEGKKVDFIKMEGGNFGWESEIIGFRMYDGKIDLYGKKIPNLFIRKSIEEKIDIHHPTNPYGADILEKVVDSVIGCGGLCIKKGEEIVNIGQPLKSEIENISFSELSFLLFFQNGIKVRMKIKGNERFTFVEIIENPNGLELYTGIRILDEEEDFEKGVNFILSWGKQKGSPMGYIGQGIITFGEINEIIKNYRGNHLIKLPSSKYLIISSWSLETFSKIKNFNNWKEEIIKVANEVITKNEK